MRAITKFTAVFYRAVPRWRAAGREQNQTVALPLRCCFRIRFGRVADRLCGRRWNEHAGPGHQHGLHQHRYQAELERISEELKGGRIVLGFPLSPRFSIRNQRSKSKLKILRLILVSSAWA